MNNTIEVLEGMRNNEDISPAPEHMEALLIAIDALKALESAGEVKKETCDNCEHNGDSSGEYCNTCTTSTSLWKKADWLLREVLAKQILKVKELEEALKWILNYPDVSVHIGTDLFDSAKQVLKKGKL